MQEFLENVFCNPPSLLDSDWKFIIVFYRVLSVKSEGNQRQLFLLVQDTICECLSSNRSTDLLAFAIKFIYNLIDTLPKDYPNSGLVHSVKLVKKCLDNLSEFKPLKKVPVYDQHLAPEEPNILKTSEQNYISLFVFSSKAISAYFLNSV